MALDLMDPTSGATAAFAGLMVIKAEQWFNTHAANWSSLNLDQKTALISAFYNRGEEWFQNEYDLWANFGDGSYEPSPYSTLEGEEFRINKDAISAALTATTTDWSPVLWNLESTYLAPCFSAGTPILLADGRRVAIEDIRAGMRVAAFDETDAAGSGPLHAGRVTRLIPGITTEWIVLDDGTRVTPGHRYLRPDGSFMAIGEIIAGDGLVVDARGNVTRVTGTLLRATDAGSDATWIAPDAIAATAIDNPGANFGDLVLGVSIRFVMAPISQELEPLANPGRSGRIQPTAS